MGFGVDNPFHFTVLHPHLLPHFSSLLPHLYPHSWLFWFLRWTKFLLFLKRGNKLKSTPFIETLMNLNLAGSMTEVSQYFCSQATVRTGLRLVGGEEVS
jgi:hypothetical protein